MKNQEQVGICWAFAISTIMDNAIRRAGAKAVIAPLHVVSAKTWDDLWKRGASRELTIETTWPYSPAKACKLNESDSEVWCGKTYGVQRGSWRSDPELVAEVTRANDSGAFRISRVETLSVGAGTPDRIAAAVASGKAVYAAFDIQRAAWADTGNSGSVISDYTDTDATHAVAVVGYRTSIGGRQFLVHNSWGPRWRQEGYAWLSEAMVRLHLRDAFTVEVTHTASPAPVPAPPPETHSNCPTGQGRDHLFGWCAPLCADGSAPRAMLCPAPAPKSSSCAPGEALDWLTGRCSSRCPSGLPPMAGNCVI